MGSRVTLAQVAEQAGVALSTASLAFSGRAPISESMRSRVHEAAEALSYAGPDPRARSLRRRCSSIIAAYFGCSLSQAFENESLLETFEAFCRSARSDGFTVLLVSGPQGAAERLSSTDFDALVLFEPLPASAGIEAALERRGIPIVSGTSYRSAATSGHLGWAHE